MRVENTVSMALSNASQAVSERVLVS